MQTPNWTDCEDKTAREIKREHEIKIRDKEIERLRAILRSERKYIKKLKRNAVAPEKGGADRRGEGLAASEAVSAFSREAVLLAKERYGLEKETWSFWRTPAAAARAQPSCSRRRESRPVITDGRDGAGGAGALSGFGHTGILQPGAARAEDR